MASSSHGGSSLGKRKIDSENRAFNQTWTDDYFFILPNRPNARPVCLICNETLSVIKIVNIKRHFESKHKDYNSRVRGGNLATRGIWPIFRFQVKFHFISTGTPPSKDASASFAVCQ